MKPPKPIARRTPIKRSTKPIPRSRVRIRRLKPRRRSQIRLAGAAMTSLRVEVWTRDQGKCVDCGRDVSLAGHPLFKMDLAHIVPRSRGGADTPENTLTKCHKCHMKEHNGGKPCPPK